MTGEILERSKVSVSFPDEKTRSPGLYWENIEQNRMLFKTVLISLIHVKYE
jgi:hypothetical protein